MPDEPKPADVAGQTGVAPEGAAASEGDKGDADQPSYVTQEQLGTVIEEKLKGATDAMFGMVRKMTADASSKPADPKPEAKPATPDETAAAIRQELDELKAQRLFDRTVPADMDAKERATLERLFVAENPEDPAAWLATELTGRATPTTPNPAPGHLAPKGAPPAGDTSSDILTWTPEDYAREYEAKAAEPQNKYDIRNKPFYSEIRKKAQARLKDVKILLPRRGQE